MAKTTAPLYTPEQEQHAKEIYRALNQSKDLFEQKIRVKKLKQVEGKVKKNKDGQEIVNEFGEPERWDDTYMLTYVAMNSGGEHTTCKFTPLGFETWEILDPNNRWGGV